MDDPSIGLIAGSGNLPALLKQEVTSRGERLCVIAFSEMTDPALVEEVPHVWLSLGEVARAIQFLKSQNICALVMAGKIQRPSLKGLKVDWKGALWLAQFSTQGFLGDDALMRFIVQKFEDEGFLIKAPHEILRPLLGEETLVTQKEPSPEAMVDIVRGFDALRILSTLDVGQALVIQEGLILGIEGAEGTNALIARCGALQKGGPGGILIKGAKSQQDLRCDPPVIGPETIQCLAEAGLQGVAFQAQRTLILETDTVKTLGDAHGLFVIGHQWHGEDGQKPLLAAKRI